MNSKKGLILLSGGLDSAVSLALEKDNSNLELALFFNYGQKAFVSEKRAVEKLCKFYNLELKIIDLMWLKNITATSLTNDNMVVPEIDEKDLDNEKITIKTKENVWIPNRNGLFLNIAASFADSFNFDTIIIGANKEEASTFTDNSENFINAVNKEFEFSTQVKPIVKAPLIKMNKQDIIQMAKKINFPFIYIWSCYLTGEKHCGKCESCKRLKRGLEREGLFDIVNLLFDIC